MPQDVVARGPLNSYRVGPNCGVGMSDVIGFKSKLWSYTVLVIYCRYEQRDTGISPELNRT
jgi:hypothetical protein